MKISIEAVIKAGRQKVWDIYTQPDHITQWNFASDDWCCPSATNDLRVGGKYCARMEAKDKSFGFDFEGIYTGVLAAEKLSYKLADNREVSVTFEDAGEATRVIVTFDAEEENSIEMQENGWQAILDNFKKYTEKN